MWVKIKLRNLKERLKEEGILEKYFGLKDFSLTLVVLRTSSVDPGWPLVQGLNERQGTLLCHIFNAGNYLAFCLSVMGCCYSNFLWPLWEGQVCLDYTGLGVQHP